MVALKCQIISSKIYVEKVCKVEVKFERITEQMLASQVSLERELYMIEKGKAEIVLFQITGFIQKSKVVEPIIFCKPLY